jgi:magnesium-protoporphyrin O-methyltransferase
VRCCATPPPGAEIFTEKQARRDARRYRKRGLDGSAARILEAVPAEGATVLEIGGGVGALGLELLKGGAARVTNVELSPAYETEAQTLLREAGLEGRVERRIGDVVKEGEAVPAVDVVVLNRVVCCYPDVDGLVGLAAGKAQHALALTYPRNAWWTRAGSRVVNGFLRLGRREFRTFVHRPERIRAAAAAQGLRPSRNVGGVLWQLAAFER